MRPPFRKPDQLIPVAGRVRRAIPRSRGVPMKPRFAALAALLCCLPTVAFAADTVVDLSSTVGLLTQLLGATLAALAVPLFWYGVTTLKNHFGLSQLAIDARTRATVDQGLQKALGYAVAK